MYRPKEIALVLSLFFMSGCGIWQVDSVLKTQNQKYYSEMYEDEDVGKVYKSSGFSFDEYDVLFVADVSTDGVFPKKDIDPDEMALVLKHNLLEEIRKVEAFRNVTDNRSVLSSGQDSKAKVLILKCTFSELEPGNRALRWFVGWGAGRVRVQIEGEGSNLINEDYLRVSNRGIAFAGVFGGNSKDLIEEALQKFAEGFASFIKREISEKTKLAKGN